MAGVPAIRFDKRRQLRRHRLHQVSWNVVQLAGAKPAQDDEGLEVGDGQAMVRKEFAAVGFELVLQPAQIARQYVRRQGLAGVLERIAGHAEERTDLGVDVFQGAHHFVAEQGL